MDWLDRSRILFGKEGIEKLKNSRVLLLGVGGVGGHVAEALARSGVGHLTLVDPDDVSLTNLNRQIVALQSTLGKNKASAMAERLRDINPEIDVAAIPLFLLPETADKLDYSSFDYIIDAIDTMAGKICLVQAAKAHQIPLISAMGAGNKRQPMGFLLSDLAKTDTCPLARSFRRECRKIGISHLTVVYSKEPAASSLWQESEETKETGRPVCGSLAFVPAAMGLTIAARVIEDLIADSGTIPH